MTSYDLAQLRGELFAIRTILVPCLDFLASRYENKNDVLDAIEKHAIEAVKREAPKFATPDRREDFVRSAVGWLSAMVQGAREEGSVGGPPLQ